MDMRLEVVILPVADVDRAKQFYTGLGWREDADIVGGDDFRIVQLTPPGSQCSVSFGIGVTTVPPGSQQGLLLMVDDIEAARAELVERGAPVSEVFHGAAGRFHPDDPGVRLPGPDPERRSYQSHAVFSDPDGNGWVLQEITTRLPGREWTGPPADVAALTEVLREAEEHHGRYEPTAPKHHWSGWYAAYVVARQQGRSQDEAYEEAVRALEADQR
jgi:catechol 2,3-dioxygenase-like lactoylglutathione lyase family enzyme